MIELRSSHLTAAIAPHGARIARLVAPDRDGVPGEVVVGLAEDDYPKDDASFGGVVGRFANRIAGSFELDGQRYQLPCNEPGVTLHGGPGGIGHAEFAADPVREVDGGQAVTLRHTSRDGENGFPGTLAVTVTYTLAGPELAMELTATTDAPTVVNLTGHSYFTLRGEPCGLDDHELTVHADAYLPVDEALLPDGGPAPVGGTPFDLTRPTRIGARLREAHPQLLRARGYDHCFVLHGRGPRAGGLPVAAHVREPLRGRTLTVFTDQPGLQVYTGNMLDGRVVDHRGRTVRQGDALCLEPQHFPDSPNRPEFPSTVLRPGEIYAARTVLRFGTDTTTDNHPNAVVENR